MKILLLWQLHWGRLQKVNISPRKWKNRRRRPFCIKQRTFKLFIHTASSFCFYKSKGKRDCSARLQNALMVWTRMSGLNISLVWFDCKVSAVNIGAYPHLWTSLLTVRFLDSFLIMMLLLLLVVLLITYCLLLCTNTAMMIIVGCWTVN